MSAPPTVLNCLLFLLKILSLSPSFSLILIFSVSTHRSICSDWLRGRRKPWLRWRCRRAETSAASQSRWTPVAGDRWRYYIPLDLKRKMSKRKTKKSILYGWENASFCQKRQPVFKKGMFVVSVDNGTGSDRYLLAAAAAEAVGFAEQLAWADVGTADQPNHTQQDMWLWTGSWFMNTA